MKVYSMQDLWRFLILQHWYKISSMKKFRDSLREVPAVAQVLSNLTMICVRAADNDAHHPYSVLVLKEGVHSPQFGCVGSSSPLVQEENIF